MRFSILLDNNAVSAIFVVAALVHAKPQFFVVFGDARGENTMPHAFTPFEELLWVAALPKRLEKGKEGSFLQTVSTTPTFFIYTSLTITFSTQETWRGVFRLSGM